ncbi:MAG: hypothetical protein R8M14_02340 [Ghiorsea sp.]
MLGLIALSFTHIPWLAAILFVFFSMEIIARISIISYKMQTNPYRKSLNRKIDALFLILDIIGIASLLITIFDIPFQAEDAALVRMFRALYLLRTLRVFRYFDLQSAMYSPTYGMFTSLVIMVSFFATDTLLWVVIIFFSVELVLRYLIMQNMNFESERERKAEWFFWWLDFLATVVMVPAFAVIPYGGALRSMRLIRLLRPWMVIIRNLKEVMREGQFMQEINLIVLVLAVISIAGGIFGNYTMAGFDFTQDGVVDEHDDGMIPKIWFAFRLFTDPGNSVTYPENSGIAIYSIVAVIVGVFIFAFFIGIGANIVSDLMAKLRNERLVITRHMVMFGWNDIAPYIITHLRLASERSFSHIKLVLLHEDKKMPSALLEEKWVTYRYGDRKQVGDLKRVNLSAARQALVLLPTTQTDAESLPESFFSLLAIRNIHPDINLSIALPGMSESRIKEHKHMLQVGWDNIGEYNKPTVILSAADFRANAIKNIIHYSDFDQIMSRLMIPERTEESSLQVIDWEGSFTTDGEQYLLSHKDNTCEGDIFAAAQALLLRGCTLLGLVDDEYKVHALYQLKSAGSFKVCGIAGIALNENALHGELYYVLNNPAPAVKPLTLQNIAPVSRNIPHLRLLITGWIDGLPLLLQRLLPDHQHIDVVLLDNFKDNDLEETKAYIQKRLADEVSLSNISLLVQQWDYSDMEVLREHTSTASHIILAAPRASDLKPYTVITTILSHIVSMVKTGENKPKIFPILHDRTQARLLQDELDRFSLPAEVHLVVPDEFYGAYVAHTNFNMYTAETEDVYRIKRTLRHIIHDFMSDDAQDDSFELHTIPVTDSLPNEPEALYASLLEQGYIWIGYRLNHAFVWHDPVQDMVRKIFPRESDFHCLRQFQIIINPFGNPVSRRSWENHRDDIAELIVIGENIASDEE